LSISKVVLRKFKNGGSMAKNFIEVGGFINKNLLKKV